MARSKPSESVERPDLSRLETGIMNVVWNLGECSSAEVIAAYTPKRALAGTTIRTVLANLRKKGYIEPVPTIERGFRLKPVVSRSNVARRSLRSLVAGLFDGSPRQAVVCLLRDERLNEKDLEDIRGLIEEARARRKRS